MIAMIDKLFYCTETTEMKNKAEFNEFQSN